MLVIVGRQLNNSLTSVHRKLTLRENYSTIRRVPELFERLVRSSWIGIVNEIVVNVANYEMSIF